MSQREHDDLQNLLGAFVLNAVEPLERRRVERHLETCSECAREVRLLGEAAAELSWLPGAAPADELVEKISAALPARRTRIGLRTAGTVAAVAMVVAGFFGAAFVRERSRNAELAEVLAASDRRVPLSGQTGFDGQGVLYIADGRAALVLEGVPGPGEGRAYQLWALSGTKPTSMTVVGGGDRVVRLFDWSGRADRFAVTIEPAGGSPVPTSDPVLLGA
jgi:anti-sigma-K factor RskA